MKTAKELIERFKEPIRSQIIEARINENRDDEENFIDEINFLLSGLYWDKSIQGGNYWMNISNNLNDYLIPLPLEGTPTKFENITYTDGAIKFGEENLLSEFKDGKFAAISNEIEEKVLEIDHLSRLTQLQKEIGYKEGELSPVALLGLVCEAGEVLSEVNNFCDPYIMETVINGCKLAGHIKKRIRDNKELEVKVSVYNKLSMGHVRECIDEEIADTLYYLNILALNRGKTLNDYADLSYKKVIAKQAE